MWLGRVTLLVEMLLPRPLSVLVVEFLQPELAPEPTVTLLDTESWPGDWRSGEREGRLSPPPASSMLEVPGPPWLIMVCPRWIWIIPPTSPSWPVKP